jgi:NTE family protein
VASERTAGPRRALVLSGGGARGAYEAGVLSYIFSDLAEELGRPAHFDVVTGSSVGAIHAAYTAATQGEPDAGERLTAIWRSLSFEKVLDVSAAGLLRIPLQLLRGPARVEGLLAGRVAAPDRLPGLFGTAALEDIVLRSIDWKAIRRNLDSGALSALAVVATEIATGRSVVFVDSAAKSLPPWTRDPYIVERRDRIERDHTLASAAIPLLFPAVRIGSTFYCDGGLRLNTPLVPALRLGADRVLIVGLRYPAPAHEQDRTARRRLKGSQSLPYLAGKALNALLLDRIDTDVDRLRLFNAILESGAKTYGSEFLREINKPIIVHRNTPYRIVEDLYLQPSRDLGELAGQCLKRRARSGGLRGWIGRNVTRYATLGADEEADLLSYLFFDHCYAEHLIELGRNDAHAAREELLKFFAE